MFFQIANFFQKNVLFSTNTRCLKNLNRANCFIWFCCVQFTWNVLILKYLSFCKFPRLKHLYFFQLFHRYCTLQFFFFCNQRQNALQHHVTIFLSEQPHSVTNITFCYIIWLTLPFSQPTTPDGIPQRHRYSWLKAPLTFCERKGWREPWSGNSPLY